MILPQRRVAFHKVKVDAACSPRRDPLFALCAVNPVILTPWAKHV